MVLPLPDLDDRTYADLVEEMRSLIPIEFPTWTDHNPSDVGIVLIELLAWITETVLYRVNQVTDANKQAFLRLLNPPGWQPPADLQAAIQATVLDLRQRYRAITPADYEHLLLDVWPQKLNLEAHRDLTLQTTTALARVHCIPGVRPDPAQPSQLKEQPGHLTLVVVPKSPDDPDPVPSLTQWLEPCRLLTTHHHLIGPSYVRVRLGANLYLNEGANPVQVLIAALTQLQAFFSPLPGTTDGLWQGQGWPFGRAVYPSEIYQLLDQLPGVDYVADLSLARMQEGADASTTEPSTGEESFSADTSAPVSAGQTLISIQAHELPQLDLTAENFKQFFTLKERRGSDWSNSIYDVDTVKARVFPARSENLVIEEQPAVQAGIPDPLADATTDSTPSTVPPSIERSATSLDPSASNSKLKISPYPVAAPPPYHSYLPAILQTDSLLIQFLNAFEKVLSGVPPTTNTCPGIIDPATSLPQGLETIISLTHTYFDPQKTPAEFLPWLAGWVDLSLQDNWPLKTKQQFIDQMAFLYRQRGTKAALEKILRIYLESADFGEVSQKATITEFENYPHFFQVSLTLPNPDPNLYWKQARIAKNIIDQEKPAHTYYALRILVPTMQINNNDLDRGLRLGENTVLGNQEGGI